MNEVGLPALTQNQTLFLPISQIQLMTELEKDIKESSEKIVFILEHMSDFDKSILKRVNSLKERGFRFALRFRGEDRELQPFADYIMLHLPVRKLVDEAKRLQRIYPKAMMVAMGIEEKPIYDQIKHSIIDLFDGPFYKIHIPTSAKYNTLSPLKVNYIQLLKIVNEEDFDFKNFASTVRQDMALAIQFMKLVNSTGKTSTEIKNINQAAAMLGQREIKKWVSTAVTNSLCADSPTEIMRISLVRAKFCENMAGYYELAMDAENLFLTGLFSVLDVVLDLPIEEALAMVAVPQTINQALIDGSGKYADVLHFVLEYEHGAWKEISRIAMLKHFTIEQIHDAYRDAMLWYSNLITMSAPENDEELL